ncbi:ammonium transporter [Staphylococcus pasteuri]|uniref:ammonium transporter n=1 Tax=Staphylococcus pasteuri TaxID=45972 RepID=UPI001E491448|nr:ammonium transporter [Staphylococcus pasteuri]MCD9067315.1 ammonium transporter [Staphylococcus pasteuri]
MNLNDTMFLFLCTLLVWLMTPGLSLFYGGLVQSKNVLNTVMQSMSAIIIVTFAWAIIGFSLSFSKGNNWIGGLEYFGLNHVGFDISTSIDAHIPLSLFMLFQMMFCTISVSILSGSVAEKMKFIPYLIFVFIWVILVYSPVAHWVWGKGWISQLGALDFAGGTVVHITSGVSGLVLGIMIGIGKKQEKPTPHNLLITLIGGILVWIGWYGFNVGSAFTYDKIAAVTFVNTVIAASAGAFGWLLIEYKLKKTTSLLGLLSGSLSGLVTITPAAGYVSYLSSMFIAIIGGIICYIVINYIKVKLKYNDALDAFGIHGIGGIFGAICTSIFQSNRVNNSIQNGFIYSGDFKILGIQILSVITVIAFSGIMTFLIAKIIRIFTPLATTPTEDRTGLDQLVHGENAYFYGELNKFIRHIKN